MQRNDTNEAARSRAATRADASTRRWRLLRWLLRLRGSPRAIAGGAAIGMIVAFTPTIGFQMLLALGIATLAGANRPAAVGPTWLTNPVTIAPVYAFTYYVGSFFWPGPEPATVARQLLRAARDLEALDPLALRAQLQVLLELGTDVFIAMWIGGLCLGLPLAAITYLMVLGAVRQLRERRARRRDQRRKGSSRLRTSSAVRTRSRASNTPPGSDTDSPSIRSTTRS